MRTLFSTLAACAVAIAAASASAAPVLRPATLTMTLGIQNLSTIIVSGSASVTVDDAAGTIALPAGAVTLATTVNIPVTTTTAVGSLWASKISNQAGTFSFGGAGVGIPGTELPCPPGGPGIACANQTGFGGVMALTGTIQVAVIPMVIVIPVDLNAGLIGQGGAAQVPSTPGGFLFDAAPWTGATGSVAFTETSIVTITIGTRTVMVTNSFPSTVPTTGTVNATLSQLTLVTPTFVSALGNTLPVFSTFTIRFTDGGGLPPFLVPEPSTLLLLGAGSVGLWLAGRRRR
jgi:hypothetical protein